VSGFSLIELMIVVAIILVLASLAAPEYLKVQQKAYEVSSISFLRTLQSQQEAYRLANGYYADNFNDLGLYAGGPTLRGAPLKPEEILVASLPFRAQSGLTAPLAMWSWPAKVVYPDLESVAQTSSQTSTSQDTKYSTEEAKKKAQTQEGGPGAVPPTPGSGTSSSGSGPQSGGTGTSTEGGGATGAGSGSGATSGGGTSGTGGATGGLPGGQTGGTGGSGSGSNSQKSNVVVKSNSIFTLMRPTPTSWWCSVEPVRNRADSRFFFIDQTGTIRFELGRPATQSSPVM
jgi:prepilin-type N-terminal cleavage/methylation domain-containing protein